MKANPKAPIDTSNIDNIDKLADQSENLKNVSDTGNVDSNTTNVVTGGLGFNLGLKDNLLKTANVATFGKIQTINQRVQDALNIIYEDTTMGENYLNYMKSKGAISSKPPSKIIFYHDCIYVFPDFYLGETIRKFIQKKPLNDGNQTMVKKFSGGNDDGPLLWFFSNVAAIVAVGFCIASIIVGGCFLIAAVALVMTSITIFVIYNLGQRGGGSNDIDSDLLNIYKQIMRLMSELYPNTKYYTLYFKDPKTYEFLIKNTIPEVLRPYKIETNNKNITEEKFQYNMLKMYVDMTD